MKSFLSLSSLVFIVALTFTFIEASQPGHPQSEENIVRSYEDDDGVLHNRLDNFPLNHRSTSTKKSWELIDSDQSDDEDYTSSDGSSESHEIEEEDDPIPFGLKLGVIDDLGKHALVPKILKEGLSELILFGYLHLYAKEIPPKYIRCCGNELAIPDGARALLITILRTGNRQSDIQINPYPGMELPSFQTIPKLSSHIQQLPIFIQVKDYQPKSLEVSNTTSMVGRDQQAEWSRQHISSIESHAPKQPSANLTGEKFPMREIKAMMRSSLKQSPKPEWPSIQVAIHHNGSISTQEMFPLRDELIKRQGLNSGKGHGKLQLDSSFFLIKLYNLTEDVVAIRLANGSILFPSDLWTIKSKSTLSSTPSVLLALPRIKMNGKSKGQIILEPDDEPEMKLLKSSPRRLSISKVTGPHFMIFMRHVRVNMEGYE